MQTCQPLEQRRLHIGFHARDALGRIERLGLGAALEDEPPRGWRSGVAEILAPRTGAPG